MNIIELRARIDSALLVAGVPLGTYTYDGQTTPALWVDEGKTQEGGEVQGLEVTVYLNPEPKVIHTFKHTIVLREWLFTLYNRSKDAFVLEAALKALSNEFIHVRDIRFMRAADEDGIVEAISFVIPE